VALANNPVDGVLSVTTPGTNPVTAVQGLATFTGLALDTVGNGYTLQVSSGGLTSTTTGALNVTPPATQLAVTSLPPTSVIAGSSFGLTVSVEDAFNHVVPSFNGNVTIALASDPGGGNLGGTLTVTAVNGVATFVGLTINTVGTGYTLQATSSGLTDATTAVVTVILGPVPHLAIFDDPGPVPVGSYFLVTVDVENSQGVTETSFTGSVTLALAGNPTGATLGGNLTLPVINGQITFYGLTLNVPGSGYTIQATSSGFAAATTSSITVLSPPASPATQLVVIAQPPASVVANGGFGLTIAVADAAGNLAPSFIGSVTVAFAGKPRGAKLRGTLTVTATNGVATFSGLTLAKAQKGYKLKVTASGLTSASTITFKVSPKPRLHPAKKPKRT